LKQEALSVLSIDLNNGNNYTENINIVGEFLEAVRCSLESTYRGSALKVSVSGSSSSANVTSLCDATLMLLSEVTSPSPVVG
jgi:hypothetical protein